jgi:hypothetical protein
MLHAVIRWLGENPLLAILTFYVVIDATWNHGISRRLSKLERDRTD